MQLVFGNPAGFWAALSIPAILLIHLIQEQMKTAVTSTLFLLERLAPESVQGRRIDWIRNSKSLWLQLLFAAILSFIIAEPRLISDISVQRVVILLDSSASMSPFKDDALSKLAVTIRKLEQLAARTEYVVLETDPEQGVLYNGGDGAALLTHLQSWNPRLGTHDFAEVVDIAHRMSARNGLILLLTDRRQNVPDSINQLAVGQNLSNCGFTGGRILPADGSENDNVKKTIQFEAMLRNYSSRPVSRNYWVQVGDKKGTPELIHFNPGELKTVRGKLSSEITRLALRIEEDAFPLDDALPLLQEEKKTLEVYLQPGTRTFSFYKRVLRSVENSTRVRQAVQADLGFFVQKQNKLETSPSAIVLRSTDARDTSTQATLTRTPIVAEHGSLAAGLPWMGLLVTQNQVEAILEGDNPILWKGGAALISEALTNRGRILKINFDLDLSNAERYPGFILLLHRFIEAVRERKVAYSARNTDTGELLGLPLLPSGSELEVTTISLSSEERFVNKLSPEMAPVQRAPYTPTFFEIHADGKPLFSGAAQFTDTREADFSNAESFDDIAPQQQDRLRQQSVVDPLLPIWTLLLLFVILLSWSKPSGRGIFGRGTKAT